MKTKSILIILIVLFVLIVLSSPVWLFTYTSCNQTESREKTTDTDVVLKDYGAKPTVLNIEAYTETNTRFRTVLWTGERLQVALMSIPVRGEIGLEQHLTTDQFLRIEVGEAKVMMGDTKDALTFTERAGEDFAVLIPAGKWHNIINTGDKPLKLYSIYAPVEHPFGTVHKTWEDAMEAEHETL